MSVETKEYCDLCDRDLTFINGGMSIYRGKFTRFWHWKGNNEPRGSVTFCGPCWSRLRSEVTAAQNQEQDPASSPVDELHAANREKLRGSSPAKEHDA